MSLARSLGTIERHLSNMEHTCQTWRSNAEKRGVGVSGCGGVGVWDVRGLGCAGVGGVVGVGWGLPMKQRQNENKTHSDEQKAKNQNSTCMPIACATN